MPVASVLRANPSRMYSPFKECLPISEWALYIFFLEGGRNRFLVILFLNKKVDKLNSILIIEKGIVFYPSKSILESDIFRMSSSTVVISKSLEKFL